MEFSRGPPWTCVIVTSQPHTPNESIHVFGQWEETAALTHCFTEESDRFFILHVTETVNQY